MQIIIRGKRYDVLVKYNDDVKVYNINIVDPSWARIGTIKFKILSEYWGNETWLNSISTEPEFQHMGVGKALLQLCEYFSSLHNVGLIHGIYLPLNEHAAALYDKNGYDIVQIDQELFIMKNIDIVKTQKELSGTILLDTNEDCYDKSNGLNV